MAANANQEEGAAGADPIIANPRFMQLQLANEALLIEMRLLAGQIANNNNNNNRENQEGINLRRPLLQHLRPRRQQEAEQRYLQQDIMNRDPAVADEVPAVIEDAEATGRGAEVIPAENGNPHSSNNLGDKSTNSTALVVESEISQELSNKVFENDMLREIILNHVLFGTEKLCRSNLKCIRLVRKSWLRAAADILRKSHLPMYFLTLDNNNSLNECPHVLKTGAKLLDQFVVSTTAPSRQLECIPTFNLKLMPDFFRSDNYKNLSDCLMYCGESLLDLELSFPVNSLMTFVFPSFYLPQLQRLAVHFSDQKIFTADAPGIVNNYGHAIYPIQTVLHATDMLKELVFKFAPLHNNIPVGFELLTLPDTITGLYLDCPVKDCHLELLLKNNLPNLSSLRLFGTFVPFPDGLIFKILDKYRMHLKTLSLRGNQYQGRVRNTTLFKFPVMEKLEVITITSQCWEFEEDLTRIEKQLPKLNELRILNTTDNMFLKWTENSKYETVTRLFVSLIDLNVSTSLLSRLNQIELPMALTLEKIQSLHLAFPNVVSLEMTMWGSQTCGLKYLFLEMRFLQKLAITVKGVNEHFHAVHWDSLLIGVPPDMAMCFRKNPDCWNMVNFNDDTNYPSIRKLTALKTLALVEKLCTTAGDDEIKTPLISDMSFHFAFLRMKNLKSLLLGGRFSPSAQMSEKWKQEKGTEIHTIHRQ